MTLVRFGAEIARVWHSSLKTGPLLAPSPVTWLLPSPEFLQIAQPHGLVITRGQFTWLLPPHPVSLPWGCPLPLGPWKQDLLPFPKKSKCRAVRGWSRASWLLAIQTAAKAALPAINPFRAEKQGRDLREYSPAPIMINSVVAKVPCVCVQAHMRLWQWESLSVLSPENPLQGQSLSLLVGCSLNLFYSPILLIVPAPAENSLLQHFKPRAEIITRDELSLPVPPSNKQIGKTIFQSVIHGHTSENGDKCSFLSDPLREKSEKTDLKRQNIIMSVLFCASECPSTQQCCKIATFQSK